MQETEIRNEFLATYLQYVEKTESPRLFHVWSALSGVAATLGRRCHLPFLDGALYPNLYVLLVGPPAVKKSTAIKFTSRLLRESTGVRFAPDDTSGARQGLLAAMQQELDEEDNEDLLAGIVSTDAMTTEAFELNGSRTSLANNVGIIDLRDLHSMYISATEFTTFMGTNSIDLINCLIKLYDGDEYEYKLKSSAIILKDGLLNLLGGTTPTSINESLPAAAIGQGFMSRMILVWGNKKYARVPRPSIDTNARMALLDFYKQLHENFDGPFVESPEAAKFYDEILYDYNVSISDPRFVHYIDRRNIHLLKLSMVFAATRLSKIIERRDMECAHDLLCLTEINMPDALGEFGLSPLAHSKQRLLEFIVAATEPVSMNILWAVMHREMRKSDFLNSLADLQNAEKIMLVDTDSGPAYVGKSEKKTKAGSNQFDGRKKPKGKGSNDDLLAELIIGNGGEESSEEVAE